MYTNNNQKKANKTILHIFSTFAVGGPQVRFAQIANALDDSFDHLVISLDGNYDAKEKLSKNANVNFLKIRNLKLLPILKRLKAIREILLKYSNSYETLMTYNFGAIEWVFVNRISCKYNSVHWEDGFGPNEKTKPFFRRSLFRRLAFSSKSQVVVPSQTLMKIAKDHWKCSDAQLVYFPNGIQLPNKVRFEERKLPTEFPVYGTLATLRAEKNIFRLIDTFIENNQHGKLLIGGDGPQLQALTSYVERKNLAKKILFSGYITDVWGFLSKIDIFCVSSDTEQMPISVLEAMAYSLPIVSTDVGDIKAMLSKNNTKYVVKEKQFSQAYSNLTNQPELWKEIGLANQNKVQQHYSLEAMILNFKNLM